MKNDYICPSCRGHLKIDEDVVFSVKNEKDEPGLIFLSPELGEYSKKIHPSFSIKEGIQLKLFCPICHTNLDAKDVSNNLARIIVIEENQSESYLLFSKIVGEKCTYIIKDDTIEIFGDDSQQYMNFFGEMPKY